MKIKYVAVAAALAMHATFARADAGAACVSAFEVAQQDKIAVSSPQSRRIVNGPGRLYFHTAPDERCRLKNVFVVPSDRLEVFADHGPYTEVIYWNPATGAGTAGWVQSARLAEVREMIGLIATRREAQP